MLKNYTSETPATRSISWIEAKLAANKATQILKEYSSDGRVSAIAFIVVINGVEMPFKLPARVADCERVLLRQVRRPRPGTTERIKEQAERTAWKIVADWVDAQMAMIELAQVELMEVFMPYLFNRQTQQTYFQAMKETGFKALLPAACAAVDHSPIRRNA